MTAMTVAAGSITASVVVAPSASAALDSLTLSLSSQFIGTRTVTLDCEPTGGTHPNADAACKDLIAANGDISHIPPFQLGGCGGNYDPATAAAVGYWRGRLINYVKTFSNPCVATIETGGHVFRF
jgi:Subtilisin inhibitor-like